MVKKKNSFSAQNDELLFRKFTSSNFDNEREKEREREKKEPCFHIQSIIEEKECFVLYLILHPDANQNERKK